jgi:endoglucanase
MAYSMTVLSWGLIDYESAYKKAGELENARKAIKWGTDYFIKVRVVLIF